MKLEALCKTLLQNRWYCTTINKFRQFTEAYQQAPARKQFVLIMRLSVILLFVCAQHVSANSFSQKVTLKANKIPLTQVFNSIKQQTGYSFFWDQQLLDKAPLITVAVQDLSLADALEKCLKGLPLAYEIKGKIVLITAKKGGASLAPSTDAFFQAPAETFPVSGVVRDEKGNPLSGATVTLLALNWKTSTNDKGEFRFAGVPAGIHSLQISYVGYVQDTRYFTVSSALTGFVVKMMPEQNEQEELVISTGYQKLKKASATGSYSVITSKEIEQTPSTNLMERLEGKVPGVLFDVRNNRIQVRGVNAFNGQTPPLIVIDGFPAIDQKLTTIRDNNITFNPDNALQPSTSGNPILSSFNPADIESITFLKDAAAAAIWGANAANGVIVIETKKGKKGPASINLNTTISTSAPANMSNMDVMNSADYIQMEQELVDKNFLADPTTFYRYSAISEAMDVMFKEKRGEITAAQKNAALAQIGSRSNIDQLQKYLLQRQVTQQYNLSLSGAGDNSNYHISGNYTKNRPVLKSNESESYFITANLGNDFLNKRITVNTILNYTYAKNVTNSAASSALSLGRLGLNPYDMIVDENGVPIRRGLTYTKRVSDSLTRLGHMSWLYSPLDELQYNDMVYTKNTIRANMSVTGKIADWLNLQVSGQLQRNFDEQGNLQNLNSLATRELLNTASPFVSGKPTNTGVPVGGIYRTSNTNTEDYGLRAQLNFNKTWNNIHQLSVIAGSEIRQTKAFGYAQTRYGYDEETSQTKIAILNTRYNTFPNGTAQLSNSDNIIYKARTRYLSYYSTLNYSFLNKYFVSGSVRFDDGTMIGVDRRNRAVPLWSVGGRWDMKKENFLSGISWLNNLSARATLGKSGSFPKGTPNVNTVNIGLVDGYTLLPYASLGSVANDDLGWATTRTLNFGLDAAMFENRLSVSADLFYKRTTGLIINVPFNPTYGINSLAYNTADLSGNGIEFGITGQIIRSRDWQWTANLNFSYNTTNVTDNRYPKQAATGGNVTTTGYPVDNLFVYRWAGLDSRGHSQVYDAKGIKYADDATNFKLTADDYLYAGRTTPPYFGGFSNTFQYKNLSLSVRATYYLGHKFLMQDLNAYPTSGGFGGLISTSKALVNRWRQPGDEARTNVPGIATNNTIYTTQFYSNSDYSVRDAGQVRLQQITLGYQLPKEVLRRVPVFKAASINATVSNLGIIWRANKDGIDPDYIMTGTFSNLPPSVNYVMNLNLTF
jgi:TonB-linked SusC/RagA family outer membrane protein